MLEYYVDLEKKKCFSIEYYFSYTFGVTVTPRAKYDFLNS